MPPPPTPRASHRRVTHAWHPDDSEVEVGVPNESGRAEILTVLLRGIPHAMDTSRNGSEGVKEIAARTHGFVGADLQLLVKEAALQALRRSRTGSGGSNNRVDDSSGAAQRTVCSGDRGVQGEREEGKSRETAVNTNSGGSAVTVVATGAGHGFTGWVGTEGATADGQGGAQAFPVLTLPDFRAALPLVSPSGLREVAVEVPSVRWDDIGGMEGVKQSLREVVEWPLRHPEAFQRMGMSPPRGVLLYGPPGCSKTLMARALATESGMNFLAIKGKRELEACFAFIFSSDFEQMSMNSNMLSALQLWGEVRAGLGHYVSGKCASTPVLIRNEA